MDLTINSGLSHNERCDELAHPHAGNFVLSWFILLGILVSYMPQHYRIIHRRTSAGISPYFVLLGTISGTSAIANILTLPASRQDIACCKVNSAFSCTAGLLGVAQVGLQWSCFFLITFLYLIFVPRQSLKRHGDGRPSDVGLIPTNEYWQRALAVVSISILHFIIVFIVSVVMLGAFPRYLQIWADILGIMGATLASIQYLPQILQTFMDKDIGSFSIPMMCIQTPGSFVFAASLAIRLGREGWSAWTVYLVTGVLQGILLAMAITYNLRNRREAARLAAGLDEDALSDDEAPGETDPLVGNKKLQQQAQRRVSDILDPHRLKPDPSSSEEDRDDGRALRGSGSSHTFQNVANALAVAFGLGSRPGTRETSRDEGANTPSPPLLAAAGDDDTTGRARTRGDSWATVQKRQGVPTPLSREASPFTVASRRASHAVQALRELQATDADTLQEDAPSTDASEIPQLASSTDTGGTTFYTPLPHPHEPQHGKQLPKSHAGSSQAGTNGYLTLPPQRPAFARNAFSTGSLRLADDSLRGDVESHVR